jgi:hypothetical protein
MPVPTYSHPPHPSEVAASPGKLQKGGERHVLHDHDRDPHTLPSFDLAKPSAPVLYLPPLLSSLPERFPRHDATTSNNAPLITATRLPDIDPASLSLHKALHHFQPVTSEYAEVPYDQAFNWDELELPEEEEREWYCVAFRSQRKAGSDGERTCSS